jgi:hypothetical protein
MILSSVLGFLFGLLFFNNLWVAMSWSVFALLIHRIFNESSKSFMFREWGLLLYCINYLISPAITYQLNEDLVLYAMKIEQDAYYSLALPGFVCLSLGMFLIPTTIFSISLDSLKENIRQHERILKTMFWITLGLKFNQSVFPGELGFFIYLLASIRFICAFALISVKERNWLYIILVLSVELAFGFLGAMYHDALMWFIFFGLYYLFVKRPSFQVKLLGGISIFVLVLFVQAVKSVYRSAVWTGEQEASLEVVKNVGVSQADSKILLSTENLLQTLNRGNQAWIFASTVDRMDRVQDFQGMNNVNLYLEAALLPRFLAPNKLTSGNKEIFNAFSGHTINEETSMGLGIFADGYIAYGFWGVYAFGFALGLILSLSFKIIERWTNYSPLYVLTLLPLLNYAVRPDCELQTTINHLSKGLLLFWIIFLLTRQRFKMTSAPQLNV